MKIVITDVQNRITSERIDARKENFELKQKTQKTLEEQNEVIESLLDKIDEFEKKIEKLEKGD